MEITWHRINTVSENLIKILRNSGKRFDWIYGVPRGGLIPAVIMSHKLGIQVIMDLNHKGRILVVDDILDSGETLAKVKAIEGVVLAPLFIRKNKTTVVKADFYGEAVDTDAWLLFPWEDKNAKSKDKSGIWNIEDTRQHNARRSKNFIG